MVGFIGLLHCYLLLLFSLCVFFTQWMKVSFLSTDPVSIRYKVRTKARESQSDIAEVIFGVVFSHIYEPFVHPYAVKQPYKEMGQSYYDSYTIKVIESITQKRALNLRENINR